MDDTEVPIGRARPGTYPKRRAYALAASVLSLLTVFVACSGDSLTGARPGSSSPSAVRAAVTGPAADAIAPNGQIQLAAPPSGGEERELTAAEAVAFASAWTRDYAPMSRQWLEETHGGSINFQRLQACGRPLYARSGVKPAPNTVPEPFRRISGPWWLVTLCNAGSPALSVAVSAWATDLTFVRGKLHFPLVSGSEVFGVGISAGHVGEYPISPEAAIEIAAAQTGKRVSGVPELITPLPRDGPPQLARWRMTLEAASLVHTNSGNRSTSELFVHPTRLGGREIVASVAMATQPDGDTLTFAPLPVPGERYTAFLARAIPQHVVLSRRADTPLRVEPISSGGN